MPWCPKCKCEYREGFTICADCDEDLVEELQPEAEIELNEQSEWSLFFQTNNEREAEIIESLLRATGIPFLRKDRGAGGYLKIAMGMTNLGVDIYVPDSRLEAAKDLIPPTQAAFDKREDEELVAKSNQRSTKIEKRYKKRSRFVFLYWIVIPIIMSIIITYWEYFRR